MYTYACNQMQKTKKHKKKKKKKWEAGIIITTETKNTHNKFKIKQYIKLIPK